MYRMSDNILFSETPRDRNFTTIWRSPLASALCWPHLINVWHYHKPKHLRICPMIPDCWLVGGWLVTWVLLFACGIPYAVV
jgi:hypothetical protein